MAFVAAMTMLKGFDSERFGLLLYFDLPTTGTRNRAWRTCFGSYTLATVTTKWD